MPKRKSAESGFVKFAMTAPVEAVSSAIETMKAILVERKPKVDAKDKNVNILTRKRNTAPDAPVSANLQAATGLKG